MSRVATCSITLMPRNHSIFVVVVATNRSGKRLGEINVAVSALGRKLAREVEELRVLRVFKERRRM